MAGYFYFFPLFLIVLRSSVSGDNAAMKDSNAMKDNNDLEEISNVVSLNAFMFWRRGIVPFYIEPEHFDAEQQLDIMKALMTMMYKSCLRFQPVMGRPEGAEHVLVFENPQGIKKCSLDTSPHSIDEPHKVIVGYDCMSLVPMQMLIMRALGFPFEHNRAIRDDYIEVQPENVEPGYVELFTKDLLWPEELRKLPYDRASVMHFSEREFSKNGHKTIIFKGGLVPRHMGLTSGDLKKIRIVYEKECRLREYEEKLEECKNYAPPASRRKRGAALRYKSLRVNRNITPPVELNEAFDKTEAKVNLDADKKEKNSLEAKPGNDSQSKAASRDDSKHNDSVVKTDNVTKGEKKSENEAPVFRGNDNTTQAYAETVVKELGVEKEVDDLVALVHKVGAVALQKARENYCNGSKPILRTKNIEKPGEVNLLGIIHDTVSYAQSLVNKAVANLTEFCEDSNPLDNYERSCPFFDAVKCPKTNYKSTKSGPVKYSTQHRPLIRQSTKHEGYVKKDIFRSGSNNDTEPTETNSAGTTESVGSRRKRDLQDWPLMRKNHMFRARRSVDENKKESSRGLENVSLRRDGSGPEQMDYNALETNKKKSKKHKKPRPPGLRTTVLSQKNREFYEERKWPDNVVRYYVKESGDFNIEDLRKRLGEVNSILKKQTCVRIHEIKEGDMDKYEDYLVLDNSPDYVTGRVGGKQNFGVVELLKGGQHRQHTAMMVMAMLGFYFEVSRHDRDSYIRVHNRHVRPDKLHHFEKIREDATFDLPYDYKSATHPAWQFWRQLGRTGISTVATFKESDPDGSIMKALGQNSELLSELDLVKINSVYGTDCFSNDAASDPEDNDEGTVEEEEVEKEVKKEVKKEAKKEKKEKRTERNREQNDEEKKNSGEQEEKEVKKESKKGKNNKRTEKKVTSEPEEEKEVKKEAKKEEIDKESEKSISSEAEDKDEKKDNDSSDKEDTEDKQWKREGNNSSTEQEGGDKENGKAKKTVNKEEKETWQREGSSSNEKEASKSGSD